MILSTDPYLFGNGANLEHFINFFAVASLALLIHGWDRTDRWPLVASGVCLGAATLVKQVAIAPVVVFVAALAWRAWTREIGDGDERAVRCLLDIACFGLGLASIMVVAAAILIARGAGAAAYDDIFRYGRALATDTLPEPNAPPALDPLDHRQRRSDGPASLAVRNDQLPRLVGNRELAALAGLDPGRRLSSARARRDARSAGWSAAWTLAAWAQVALPGLYWPHYYLLPIAGAAITVAVCWADATAVSFSVAPDRKTGTPQADAGNGQRSRERS